MSEYVIKTASGSIASFSDGADNAPCKSVKCSIIASGGGGTPSAPVPIVGASSITVRQRGKNLIDGYSFFNTKNIVWGAVSQSALADGSLVLKAGTYTFSGSKTSYNGIYVSSDSETLVSRYNTNSATFTLTETTKIKLMCYVSTEEDLTQYNYQLEIGSTATTYEAYKSKTPITVSLGQTVYGGTLAEDGTLTVTHAINTIDGDSVLTDNGTQSYGGRQVGYTPSPEKEPAQSSSTQNSDLLCDYFGTDSASGGLEGKVTGRATNNKVYFSMPSDVTTLALAKQWFTDNPTHLVYKLATPIVITGLDKISLSTYLGMNNFWCDSGDIEISYYSFVETANKYLIQSDTIIDITDKLREKLGTTTPIEVTNIPNEILKLDKPLPAAEEASF